MNEIEIKQEVPYHLDSSQILKDNERINKKEEEKTEKKQNETIYLTRRQYKKKIRFLKYKKDFLSLYKTIQEAKQVYPQNYCFFVFDLIWSYRLRISSNLFILFHEFLKKSYSNNQYNNSFIIRIFLKWFYFSSEFYIARHLLLSCILSLYKDHLKQKQKQFQLEFKIKLKLIWEFLFFEYSLANYSYIEIVLQNLERYSLVRFKENTLYYYSMNAKCLMNKFVKESQNNYQQREQNQNLHNATLIFFHRLIQEYTPYISKTEIWKWELFIYLEEINTFHLPIHQSALFSNSFKFLDLLRETPKPSRWISYYIICETATKQEKNRSSSTLFPSLCSQGRDVAPSRYKYFFDICYLKHLFYMYPKRSDLILNYIIKQYPQGININHITQVEMFLAILLRCRLFSLAISFLSSCVKKKRHPFIKYI